MKILFKHKNKKINLEVRRLNFFQRFLGLMFKSKREARALLFDFKKPTKFSIHSLFVFFEFVAVWLDDKNKIVDIKFVKPWRLRIVPKKKFSKLIEIPVNNSYKEVVDDLGFPRR